MSEVKTKTCPRCKGTGRRSCGVVHLGIPGLCYRCDGRGELKWVSADQVAKTIRATFELHKQELIEKAAYLTAKMQRTKNEQLKLQLGSQLDELRHAWRTAAVKAANADFCKGEWR